MSSSKINVAKQAINYIKDKLGAYVIGEFIATSYTDASSISFIYLLEFLKEPVFFIFNLKIIIYCYFSCIIQI